MYKIFDYDINVFCFRDIITDIIGCDIEELHMKHAFITDINNITGGYNPDTDNNDYTYRESANVYTEKIFKRLKNNNIFLDLWYNFRLFVKHNVFDGESIFIQKLPSLRIFPSDTKNQYSEKLSMYNGALINLHRDCDPPYYHPPFELNFWLSLIDTDEYNSLYIENSGNLQCLKMNYGQLLMFNDVVHGAFLHNTSQNTRISIDFKSFLSDNYQPSILTDKLVKKRGSYYKQNEWYSEKYYYDKL